MDPSNFIPFIAQQLGVSPTSLLGWVLIITTAANVTARLIPQDATGTLGTIRKICSIVGVYVSSRVSSGVSVNDVAKAALNTPPIPQKVAAEDPPTK